LKDPIRIGQLPPEFDVMTIRFGSARKPPNRDAALARARIGVGHGRHYPSAA